MDLSSYNIKVGEGALEISVFNLCVFLVEKLKQKQVNSLSKDTQEVSGRSRAVFLKMVFDYQWEHVVSLEICEPQCCLCGIWKAILIENSYQKLIGIFKAPGRQTYAIHCLIAHFVLPSEFAFMVKITLGQPSIHL